MTTTQPQSISKRKFNYGHYYVGDPCYAIQNVDHDLWMDFVNGVESTTTGEFNFMGYRVWAHGTKHGDGTYYDKNMSAVFAVDSGLISIIPIGVLDKMYMNGTPKNLVHNLFVKPNIFELDMFYPEYHEGVFSIGKFIINTN